MGAASAMQAPSRRSSRNAAAPGPCSPNPRTPISTSFAAKTSGCGSGSNTPKRSSASKKSCRLAGHADGDDRAQRDAMMQAVMALAAKSGLTASACAALGLARASSRASVYRARSRRLQPPPSRSARLPPPRALGPEERNRVLDLLRTPRFVDLAPAEIYATLLDEGVYLCSIRTLYCILAEEGEVRERRDQRRHPVYQKPELLAEAPNQVWSWDITKLMGPAKWSYFYLSVILDTFSRRVVGWCVADAEDTALFKDLFDETFARHDVPAGQLTLHADRGGPRKAKATAFLLADLGVTKSHSRPHTSNDNPFSEAHFKTLKYQPQFPKRFGCIEDARTFCRRFFTWYNQGHHHVGIGLMTPDQVHYGQAKAVHAARQDVLAQAYQANPERFVRKVPVPSPMPTQTWINPPRKTDINQA